MHPDLSGCVFVGYQQEVIMTHYDIIVVGSGAGGVFLAYELTKRDNTAKVLFVDKGCALEQRKCPISLGQTDKCIKCKPCHIMNGYGGAGGLSVGGISCGGVYVFTIVATPSPPTGTRTVWPLPAVVMV